MILTFDNKFEQIDEADSKENFKQAGRKTATG
jgi:hypothetical protein